MFWATGMSRRLFCNQIPTGRKICLWKKKQNVSFETFNCVSFGTLSAIETMMFRLFGEKVNYSDRWIGIMAGTNAGTNGNDRTRFARR